MFLPSLCRFHFLKFPKFSIFKKYIADEICSAKSIREILKLQQKLIEKAIACDSSLVRSLKFKREIEAVTSSYIIIYKQKICSAKQTHITNFFCH